MGTRRLTLHWMARARLSVRATPYRVAMDGIPDPREPCPHWFWRGVVAGARASLTEWAGRRERAVCVLCGELVELAEVRGKVRGMNPPTDPPRAAGSRSLPAALPGDLAGTAQPVTVTRPPILEGIDRGHRCAVAVRALGAAWTNREIGTKREHVL